MNGVGMRNLWNTWSSRAGLIGIAVCMVAWLPGGGCTSLVDVPDQSRFEDLEALAQSDEAVVRVYVAPVRVLDFLATHAWFVVKTADEHAFTRWEVSHRWGEPYGYVRMNFREPEADVGAGGAFILTELMGEEAARVVEFINNESPLYPCRDLYLYYPGPNSNTYMQWVLDQTGWDVTLPSTSIGQYTPVLCR